MSNKEFEYTEYGYRGSEELKTALEEIKELKEQVAKLQKEVEFLKGLRLR